MWILPAEFPYRLLGRIELIKSQGFALGRPPSAKKLI